MRLAIVLAACGVAFGQGADPKLTFEVASVKQAGAPVRGQGFGVQGGPGTSDPGRITYSRASLGQLVAQAYDVMSDQILGPEWLTDFTNAAYTVTATMPADTTRAQFRIMMQNLLAERFRLKVHRETQLRAGYELTVAPGGLKVKPWVPADAAASEGRQSMMSVMMTTSGRPAPVRLKLRETMEEFCRGLGGHINASNGIPMGGPQPRVVDKTGLPGIYEFALEFAGVMFRPTAPSVPASSEAGAPAASDPGDGVPNLFKAVEEQLGLKLVKVKDVSVEVIVVDQVDKVPTEN
jgi:uncharacterized protein (TIGR03435 family)